MKSYPMRVSKDFKTLVDEIRTVWKNDLERQGKKIQKISDTEITDSLVDRIKRRIVKI